MSRPETDSFALVAVPGAIASIPQFAESCGDVHEAAEDSLDRVGTVRPGLG